MQVTLNATLPTELVTVAPPLAAWIAARFAWGTLCVDVSASEKSISNAPDGRLLPVMLAQTTAESVVAMMMSSSPAPTEVLVKTLLVMEFVAHAPLSWHRSKTGQANAPFYDNAESVVAFVDGHVDLIKIYYDGINPAFSRDPIGGYAYKYGGE